MNKFLDDLFEEPTLNALKKWSQEFWKVDSKNIRAKFAQLGYEDKGYGHIQRIISNVGELLETYFERLRDLDKNQVGDKAVFLSKLKTVFKPNLILFYVSVHMHDIGMKFPGIFKALSEYVMESGPTPQHIGKIIHDKHQYASFIILIELSYFDSVSNKLKGESYLKNIVGNEKDIRKLTVLNSKLNDIYNSQLFKFIGSFEDFKIILAILCLLHKNIEYKYIQNILKNFTGGTGRTKEIFNKWWCYFERSKMWTDKIFERFSRTRDDNKLPECKDAELLIFNNNTIIDLGLVEALLQYGDKTDITIARLARKQFDYNQMPLMDFVNDTAYDDRKGYICTDMAQKVISDFARARACYFIPVLLITVKKEENQSVKKTASGLNIIIHYLRFEGDKGIFKYIRYQNEKDFYDLGFLRVIRFHIPTVIHHFEILKENPVFDLKFRKKEHSIKDKDVSNFEKLLLQLKKELSEDENKKIQYFVDTMKGLNQIIEKISENKKDFPGRNFPYTTQNCNAIKNIGKPPKVQNEKKQAFYESCDLKVPADLEIMAVLNLFHKEG